MKVLVTCPFGISSLLGNELKRLKLKPFGTFERGCYVDTDWKGIYMINLWSRLANKVYLLLDEKKITDFDILFDTIESIDWENYLTDIADIRVKVVSRNSALHSERTIQSIVHKAIITSLKKNSQEELKKVSAGTSDMPYKDTIYVHIEDDTCQIFVNTSGASLHQRGYRLATGEAPLKENLAVALLLLSGWKFKFPLVDPFCGSGTVLIEGALLAKNVAPGSFRAFAFQKFLIFDEKIWEELKTQAKKSIFDKSYALYGYDSNPEMDSIVRENAQRAGVADIIHFEVKNFENFSFSEDEPFWLVTNPPYGKRLDSENITDLYSSIAQQLQNCRGGLITSFLEFGKNVNEYDWVRKQLYNGADLCYFWYRK